MALLLFVVTVKADFGCLLGEVNFLEVRSIQLALLLFDSGAKLEQLRGDCLLGFLQHVDQLPGPRLVTHAEECVGQPCVKTEHHFI